MAVAPGEEREIHEAFDITLIIKGIHAFAEVVIGALLSVVSARRIASVVHFLLAGELSEDPHDVIANYLLRLAHDLGGTGKSFVAFYLLTHGIMNGLMVILLWKEKLWAYPASIVVLAAFVCYQLYLLTFGFSWWILVIAAFDVAVIFLAWHEYGVLKKKRAAR